VSSNPWENPMNDPGQTSVTTQAPVNPHRIGLSISFCIAAIMRGDVEEDKVEKIVGGTACTSNLAWDKVIQRYREEYWDQNPDLGEEILRRFIAQGKIEQPRLDGRGKPVTSHNTWVTSMDEVEFRQ
jgi:hypothetical protein